MPSHVLVNGLGLTYKSTIGISIATIPDVCKTPSPGGPIPIPYPNIANQGTLGGGTTTVKAKGKMIAIKGSQYKSSNGDEPGTAGGVKSNVNMKATDWITYSFDVKMDGKNACRHTDKKFHNNQNTVDLGGNLDPSLPVAEFPELEALCEIICDCYKNPPQSNRGNEYQQCVTKKIRNRDPQNMQAEPFYDMNKSPPELITSSSNPGRATRSPRRASQIAGTGGSRSPDVAIVSDPKKIATFDNLKAVVEIKFPGDTYSDVQKQYDAVFEDEGVEVIGPVTVEKCGCTDG